MSAFSPLSTLLASEPLPVAATIVRALPELLALPEQRQLQARLKVLQVTQLGQRQRLVNAVLRLRDSAPPLPTSSGPPATEPSVLATPPPVRDVLAGDAATRMSAAARVALCVAEVGFCVCTGGLDAALLDSAWAESKAIQTSGRMRPAEHVPIDRVANGAPTAAAPAGSDGCSVLGAIDGALFGFGQAVVDALAEVPILTAATAAAATGTDTDTAAADDTNVAAAAAAFRFARAEDGSQFEVTGRTELQVNCFVGGGASYAPHVDNTHGDGREGVDFGRCFTLLYYLNEGWDERDGGTLRVYLPKPVALAQGGTPGDVAALDVPPARDTLVIFRADRILHEVRPTRRQRLALSSWIYCRGRRAGGQAETCAGGEFVRGAQGGSGGDDVSVTPTPSSRLHARQVGAGPDGVRARLYPSDEFGPCIMKAVRDMPIPGFSGGSAKCLGNMWVSAAS